MVSLKEIIDLAYALRNPMRKAGAYSNPDPALAQRTDEWDAAEADYRRCTGLRGRPAMASKFTLEGREYLFDQAWPAIKRELELDRHEDDRSPAAQSLAAVLHYTELHTHHVLAARAKLEIIYRCLRAVDEVHPRHTEPLRQWAA